MINKAIHWSKHASKFFIRFVFGFALTLSTVYGAQWSYWTYLDDYELPSITEPIPILNENHEIAVGETILMRLEIDKPNRIAPTDKSVNIVCSDGSLIPLAPAPAAGTTPVGSFIFTSKSYTLPEVIVTGSVCEFNYINTYHPNPVTEKTIKWTSEEFKVVE